MNRKLYDVGIIPLIIIILIAGFMGGKRVEACQTIIEQGTQPVPAWCADLIRKGTVK